MLNPFKIYTPVRELVDHIKENVTDYEISIDDEGFLSCCEIKDTSWRISLAPLFILFLWKSDSVKWTTWAESWYIYKNLSDLAVDSKPQNTRQGWTKKLGLED